MPCDRPGQPGVEFGAILALDGRAAQLEAGIARQVDGAFRTWAFLPTIKGFQSHTSIEYNDM